MHHNCDIIFFSLSRWDDYISSMPFSMAIELAKTNRVFYIDHPYTLKDWISDSKNHQIQNRKTALLSGKNIYTSLSQFSPHLIAVATRLMLPLNFLPDNKLYDWLSEINESIIFNTIRRVVHENAVKDFIFINAFDPFYCKKFPSDLKPKLKIYQSMDDLSQVPYTAKHGIRLEKEMIQNYDLTLTTSQELFKLKSKYSKEVYYLPNAADTSIFSKALEIRYDTPPELTPFTGKKIVGYTGNIESRIDYQLLKSCIERYPEYVFCFVGPISTKEHESIGLSKYPNVIMTGPKTIQQLPQYLQYFDCAIIPFKKNTLTKSIYPLKINEYLSAGRSVLTTNFSEDIQAFESVVRIASDSATFVDSIGECVNDNHPDTMRLRNKFASNNTWQARVKDFWEILNTRGNSAQ